MKNIQAQYQDLLEGKMSKTNFMRNVRMQFPQHISPVTSFDDSVRILKGKRILNEAKKPEGVYGHNPNAEAETSRGIDHLNYYQVYHGIQYELARMPEITDENYVKARKKVVDNILKDPDAYKELQLANFKAVKEMDKDLEMKDVKKNNLVDKPNEMKVVEKDAKANTQDTLEKKEKKKSKTAKVPVMTQAPKSQKGVEAFATPGKEKVVKESHDPYDGGPEDLAAMARDSHRLRNNPTTVRIAKQAAKGATSKEAAAKVAVKLARAEGINDSEQITQIISLAAGMVIKPYDPIAQAHAEYQSPADRRYNSDAWVQAQRDMMENKVQALKEHILDELTIPNENKEHLTKGRVKKINEVEIVKTKYGNLNLTQDEDGWGYFFNWKKGGVKQGVQNYDFPSKEEAIKDFEKAIAKVQALKEHILDEMTTQNPHHEEFHKGMEVYKKKGDGTPGSVIEFDGHTATVQWQDGHKEDLQKNVLTKIKPEKTTMELPSSEMKPRTMVKWSNNEDKVNEDPIGQQAAGDEEEEASLRATVIKKEDKIKALKEKLTAAVKEILYINKKTDKIQSFDANRPDDEATMKDPQFNQLFTKA